MLPGSLIWSVATSGSVEAAEFGPLNLICVGDSVTYGRGASIPGGATSYPGQLATALGLTLGVDVFNLGVPSLGSADVHDVTYRMRDGYRNVVVLMIGTNDIYSSTETAQDTFDRIDALKTSFESNGSRVLVCTLPKFDVGAPDKKAIAKNLATLIRAAYPVSHVVDLDADPVVGTDAPTDSNIEDGNGHFKDPGYTVIASVVESKVPASTPVFSSTASGSIVQDANLKLWLRDWYTVSVNQTDIETRILNLAGIDQDDRFVVASSTYAERVANVINGQRVARFPGDASYTTIGQTWANLITASAWTIEGVLILNAVSATSSDAWSNHGIISDSQNNIGIFVKSNGSGGAQIQAYVYDGGAKVTAAQAVPLGAPFRFRATLSGGTLSLTVDGGVPVTVASGPLSTLIGSINLGRNTLGSQYLSADLADLRIYNNVDGTRAASNDAYDVARFGL